MSNQATPAPAETAPSRNLVQLALRLREAGVVAFLVLLGLAFGLLNDRFLSVQNLTIVASSAAILATGRPPIRTSRRSRWWRSRC